MNYDEVQRRLASICERQEKLQALVSRSATEALEIGDSGIYLELQTLEGVLQAEAVRLANMRGKYESALEAGDEAIGQFLLNC